MSISLGALTITSYFGAFKPFFAGVEDFFLTFPLSADPTVVVCCFSVLSDVSSLVALCLGDALEGGTASFLLAEFFIGSFFSSTRPDGLASLFSTCLGACSPFSFRSVESGSSSKESFADPFTLPLFGDCCPEEAVSASLLLVPFTLVSLALRC